MNGIWLRRLVGLGVPHAPAEREAATYTTRETVLVLLAAVVFTGGLIHIGAAVDHFQEFPLYTLAFSLLAAVQITWGVLLLRQPSRAVLWLGSAFTIGVIALWVASRTVGVPIAPQAWLPEKIGVADLIETAGELVTVLTALSLAGSPPGRLARIVIDRIAPVLLLVLLLSALYGVGAHAG